MKIEDLLVKVLNQYSLTIFDKNGKLIEFEPTSDWVIESQTKSYKANLNVKLKNSRSKTNYKVNIYNILGEDSLTIGISSDGRYYSAKYNKCPDDSIILLNKEKLFLDLSKLIKPGDFKDIIDIIKHDEDGEFYDNISSDFLNLVFIDYILSTSIFDKYIIKNTFISNRQLVNDLREDYEDSSDYYLNEVDEDKLTEYFIDSVDDYANDIEYLGTIDSFYDLEKLKKIKDELIKIYSPMIISKWESSLKIEESFKEIINNPEKYKLYFLNDDELTDLYNDTNKESYEIDDRYFGGAFYIKFLSIEKIDYTPIKIQYNFTITTIIDPYDGKEYENYEFDSPDGWLELYSYPNGDIDGEIVDKRSSTIRGLKIDVIIEELFKHGFKFL